MNGRELELADIRHEVPDRIPTDAICVENTDEVASMLGIEPAAVPDALGICGRIVSAPYTGPVQEADGVALCIWGTPATGDYGTARGGYPLAGAGSVADVERHAWPDPARHDFAAGAQAARELSARYAVRGPYWHPIFCRLCDLMGMEQGMATMRLQPRLAEAVLAQVFEFTAGYCQRLLDACGDAMPILCLGDDFATQRGLMISPAQWRRFLKPLYARLFEIGKSRGKFVWFHSCGDITAVLPDLIEIGMDVWETVQLHTLPVPPERLKREYGRQIAFFGGVNTQRLPFRTPAQVQEEVERCVEVLGRGGGYICGPDHHIKPDVSAGNTVALFETARSFRRADYTRQT